MGPKVLLPPPLPALTARIVLFGSSGHGYGDPFFEMSDSIRRRLGGGISAGVGFLELEDSRDQPGFRTKGPTDVLIGTEYYKIIQFSSK